MLSQLGASLNRHRALLDDQPIPRSPLRDRSSHSFNGGKICVTVGQRRRAYTNEDRVSPGNGVFGRAEMQAASLSNRLDYVLKMGFEERHNSVLQFREFLDVAFAAEDIVADLRQTGGGRETHVPRTYD